MKDVIIILFFFLIPIKNCFSQETNEDFINKTYHLITGSSTRYYLDPKIDNAPYNEYINKCKGALDSSALTEIANNILKENKTENWDCSRLNNAFCVDDSLSHIVKDKGEKVFYFRRPVFNNDKTHALIWVSLTTTNHGSHWLYVFEKRNNKWKKNPKFSFGLYNTHFCHSKWRLLHMTSNRALSFIV